MGQKSESAIRISSLCKENGISIQALEKKLGFSNGSIAKYFDVTPEWLLTGEDRDKASDNIVSECKNKNKILLKIIDKQNEINECYEKILKAKDQIEELRKQYKAI
ncbi:MAG: hypothetical protein J6N21_13320 [Butyrivibrio sp.]|nr:hypothetical protein [Butyrivibrio sp.]